MAYCVMNVDKQRRSAVYGLQLEANRQPGDGREFDLSDIDSSRTQDNVFLRRTDNWNEEITRVIKSAGVKERKDSVVMITGVYTASPDWFETHTKDEWMQYFRDCLAFHDREYGHAFNAVVHLDETTPHMQVASVPIVEDAKGMHLSAKIVMGTRADYRKRQDMFYVECGQQHGLERGERREPGEVKAHTTKRAWQIAKQEQRMQELTEQIQVSESEAEIGLEYTRQVKRDLETVQKQLSDVTAQKAALDQNMQDLETRSGILHFRWQEELDSIKKDTYTALRRYEEAVKRVEEIEAQLNAAEPQLYEARRIRAFLAEHSGSEPGKTLEDDFDARIQAEEEQRRAELRRRMPLQDPYFDSPYAPDSHQDAVDDLERASRDWDDLEL